LIFETEENICSIVPSNTRPQPIKNRVSPAEARKPKSTPPTQRVKADDEDH